MTTSKVFLKPQDVFLGFKEDRPDSVVGEWTDFVYNPFIRHSIDRQRQRLPVFSVRNHFLFLVQKHRIVLVTGETGSGKSTQLPQYLLEADWCLNGMVGITEPRRLSVTNLSARVADEKSVLLGREIGYSIHFDSCFSSNITKVKYMTEGILIREMMADPLLRQYSVIMLDEVHERSIFADIILGLMKKIMKRRKDIKLVVCSATLCNEFFKFFESVPGMKPEGVGILDIPGRDFALDIMYLKNPVADYIVSAAETATLIHRTQPMGDILIFLTGVEDVDKCVDFIQNQSNEGDEMLVVPLHSSLSYSDQLRAVQPAERSIRKIIVATNLAETSLTLENVVYVIDCGFVKQRYYDSSLRSSSMITVPISKSSARQRAGRAGRVRSGKVYRLYMQKEYSKFEENSLPEMQRTDISAALLTLLALGIDNLLRFSFISPPPSAHMVAALDGLLALGCIDKYSGRLNSLGKKIAELPVDTHLGKLLVSSNEFQCLDEILSITSMLLVKNVFVLPHGNQKIQARIMHNKFQVSEGDLITMLNVFTAYVDSGESKKWCSENFLNYKGLKRATEIRKNMEKQLERFGISSDGLKADTETVCKCITSGLFLNAAYLHHTGSYRSVWSGRNLTIHPSSVLHFEKKPQWIVYCELVQTSQPFMLDITVIKKEWLLELAPHFYEEAYELNSSALS